MNLISRYALKSIVVITITTMLFACTGKLSEVKNWELGQDRPQTSGKGIFLVYTDSGKVLVNLKAEKLLDYTNQDFPYRKFPDGVFVEFFDEDGKKTTIKSNYAIVYDSKDLIDLQGDVVITTSDSVVLNADQLYWNQSKNWVFTDVPYEVTFSNGARNKGEGFDANETFDTFNSRSNVGIQIVEDKENQEEENE
ncbi:LPS export ABC transporter periplasmic protein LptC [Gangjinia marincola]|uniref:LPS export ABC transporter periplasmic protein LptC n=1 Tax=Gangjinia marincola TaxID=578463 RepID=A0ABP3XT08_9FLAO